MKIVAPLVEETFLIPLGDVMIVTGLGHFLLSLRFSLRAVDRRFVQLATTEAFVTEPRRRPGLRRIRTGRNIRTPPRPQHVNL